MPNNTLPQLSRLCLIKILSLLPRLLLPNTTQHWHHQVCLLSEYLPVVMTFCLCVDKCSCLVISRSTTVYTWTPPPTAFNACCLSFVKQLFSARSSNLVLRMSLYYPQHLKTSWQQWCRDFSHSLADRLDLILSLISSPFFPSEIAHFLTRSITENQLEANAWLFLLILVFKIDVSIVIHTFCVCMYVNYRNDLDFFLNHYKYTYIFGFLIVLCLISVNLDTKFTENIWLYFVYITKFSLKLSKWSP